MEFSRGSRQLALWLYLGKMSNDLEFYDDRFSGWKKTRLYENEHLNAVGPMHETEYELC
jgi:hypothetical protein